MGYASYYEDNIDAKDESEKFYVNGRAKDVKKESLADERRFNKDAVPYGTGEDGISVFEPKKSMLRKSAYVHGVCQSTYSGIKFKTKKSKKRKSKKAGYSQNKKKQMTKSMKGQSNLRKSVNFAKQKSQAVRSSHKHQKIRRESSDWIMPTKTQRVTTDEIQNRIRRELIRLQGE